MDKKVSFSLDLIVNGKASVATASTTVDNLRKVVNQASDSMTNFRNGLIESNQAIEACDKIVGVLQQTVDFLNNATTESRSFESAMAAANTMAGKSGDEFAKMKKQVAGLATEIPIARDALANGLYQVISNGVPEDNWLEYLRTSARSSIGGLANLEEVVKVTSTVIKNYGLSWDAAGDIQDKIQLTAKNGVTSFEQLAQALPRVASQAATLGVSVDELMATFSTLTGASGETAEVSTQLAAIFTALIKPSSEASEMAQQMGIQFDAAAIKASGGMKNFLEQLDKDVKSYAQSSGMLEEEIYGRLFGSAESLRALTPLTTKLADKFRQNVADMSNSAGTMDQNYETMASIGSATIRRLNNKLGEYSDILQDTIGNATPYVNVGMQMLIAGNAALSLSRSFRALNAGAKVTAVLMKAFGPIFTVCSATMRGATVSASTLKLAIRGLMVSTGVGVAIALLSTVIEHLTNSSDAASDKLGVLQDAEDAFTRTSAQTKVALDGECKKLRELISAKQDATEVVKSLNDKYGEVFGRHQTAASWYDTLTKKSQIYARQLGYESQMKVYATQLAEKQIQLQDNYDKRRDLWKSGGARVKVTKSVGRIAGETQYATFEGDSEAYKNLKADGRILISTISELENKMGIASKKMGECSSQIQDIDVSSRHHNQTLVVSMLTYSQVVEKIEEYKKKLGSSTNDAKEATRLNGLIKQLEQRKKALETTYSGLNGETGGTSKPEPKFYKTPKTREQYAKNISYYSGKLTGNDNGTNQQLRANIQLWQHKIDLIDLATKKQSAPSEIRTHDDTQKVLDYLNFAHSKAAALGLDIQEINKQISSVKLSDAAIDRPAVLDSLSAIDNEIKYQQALKETSSLADQQHIDNEIKKLESLRQKRTELQKLQDRLSEVQESFDNAVSVDAKVSASIEISRLQREIDESTHGKLSIEAELEPTYIRQGSRADKRQSYSNAESRARRIQQDYEIGLIDKETAAKEIEALNRQLQKLGDGLKPIELHVDEKSVEAIRSLGHVDLTNMDSVSSSIKNLKQVTDPTAKGFATAGASCEALGSALQQLGGDSAAAKAGLVMAAIGNLVLSFSQALASCKTWVEWLAFGISGAAQLTNLISLCSGFATGGIVPGSQRQGDKVLVRVNSGEMILNQAQQARLFAIANGAALYGEAGQVGVGRNYGAGVTMNVDRLQGLMADGAALAKLDVRMKVKGRELVGVVANETRQNKRRSNIKI